MNLPLVTTLRTVWNHAGFQKYFQNTSWLLGSKIVSLVISFLTTIFIARNLGPTNFGQLSYAVSFISLFSFLANLGIDSIMYRDLIKYPEKRRSILGSGIAIKLIAGAGAACSAIFVASFFATDVSTILIIILSGTFIFNAFQVINYQFQAETLSKYPAIITVCVTLILNILKIATLYCHQGVIYLSLILLLEPILYAVFFFIAYQKTYKESLTVLRPNLMTMQSMIKDSWPLIFYGTFTLIYSRVDQIFIKHMVSVEAVGIYDAAVKLAEVWYFIPGIIVTALFPAIVNAKTISEELYHTRLRRLALFLLIIAIVVAIVVTLIAPYVIHLLYGKAFMGGVLILQIYVWGGIGVFLDSLIVNYLVAEGRSRLLLFVSLVPMISNVLLNIIWIPKWGIAGAAYATLVSYILAPLSVLFFKKTRHIVLGRHA
jgi:O-antigen/teichoic acid export membrane protein